MEEKCKEYCYKNNIKDSHRKNGKKTVQNVVLPTKRLRSNKNPIKIEEPIKEKTKPASQNITRKSKAHAKKDDLPKIDKFFKRTDKNACNIEPEIKPHEKKTEKKDVDSEPEIEDCAKSQSSCSEITEKLGDLDEIDQDEIDEFDELDEPPKKPKIPTTTSEIPYGLQVELKKAIMIASDILVKKIIQIVKEKEPDSCEIKDGNLCIYIEKLHPDTFEELWNVVH